MKNSLRWILVSLMACAIGLLVTYRITHHRSNSSWRSVSQNSMGHLTTPIRVWSEPNSNSVSPTLVQSLGLDASKSNRVILKAEMSGDFLQHPSVGGHVLGMILTHPDAPGLKRSSSSASPLADFRVGRCVGVNQPLSALISFIQQYCGIAVADATGNDRYDFDLQWDDARNADGFREALRDQLGVELLPGTVEKVQVLVGNPAR
jgi:hypothetical protein